MKTKLHHFFIVLALLAGIQQAAAQGTTAFTYQGQLHDGGTNANGAYTMIFVLYDSASGGNSIGTNTTSPTLANGLFSVNLDFGNVFNGNARWLDITITNGGVTQTLSPRVQVLPSPYAQFAAVAATVTNGAIMNAQLAGNAVASTNIQNGAVTTMQIANGAVTNQNLTANAVNATNIASGQVVKSLNGLTDSVILSAGKNVALFTNGSTLSFSAGPPNIQVFTSSGTFVVPTNVTQIMVEMWGGGGGGGASSSSSQPGGGGGAGGYALNTFTVTPGGSYPITIGSAGGSHVNGGTTYFGSMISPLMMAYGGSAGQNRGSSPGAGGSAGSSSGAVAPFSNGDGQAGDSIGGMGGPALRGGKGGWGGYSGGGSGGTGDTPGGGGGGGSGNSHSGGSGGQGVIFVYY
jgi:hypothetical protein